MARYERDEIPEFIVIHFFRAPGGELRCRATDARSRGSWIVDDAAGLCARLCGRQPDMTRSVLRYAHHRDDGDDERSEHEQRADVEEDSPVLHGLGNTSDDRLAR